MTPSIVVYSRPGCHLCELLLEELVPLVRGRAEVRQVDIDGDPELTARYGTAIPVVEFAGREICRYQLDRQAVLGLLDS